MTTTTEDTMTENQPTAAEQAETMARVTGSRSATYTIERRNSQGELEVAESATWPPPVEELPTADMSLWGRLTTPELVRAYADCKVTGATFVPLNPAHQDAATRAASDANHQRLGHVVLELRRRGVLD